MAVISVLRRKGNNVIESRLGILKNISIKKTNYHFAKANEVDNGVCDNSVNEPIRDMQISGNSVQNGTPTPEIPQEIISVGEKTSNFADLSKTVQSSSVSAQCEFRYDNKTGTLELTSTPKKFDYSILYLQRDVGVELEVGKTYYCGAKVVVSGKQTTNSTKISFGIATESKTSAQYFYKENGTYILNETFKYNGETNVRLNMHFNYGSDEYAQVKFENVYFSEVNAFEPYGYKMPINLSNGLETTTTNIYINEPLRKVGDYADYIDYKNKKVIRNVGKVVYDETSTFGNVTSSYWQSEGVTKAFSVSVPSDVFANANGVECLCNLFTFDSASGGITNTKPYISGNASQWVFAFNVSIASTIEELTTFLTSTNMEVIYQLATPTEETIEIPEISTFDGITTISAETEIEPSEITVNYWKQI